MKNWLSAKSSFVLIFAIIGLGGCAPSVFDGVRLNRKAQVYISHGQYSHAEKLLQESLNADYENSASHYWLGQCFEARQEMEKAIYEYRLAVRFNPAMNLAQMTLIMALEDVGKHAESLEAASVYLSHKKGAARDCINLAEIFSKHGLPAHTILAYEQAQKVEPNNAKPSMALAEYCFLLNNKDRAIKALIKAFEIDPVYPGLAKQLGELGLRVTIPEPQSMPRATELQKDIDRMAQ